ncbi:hypothetical protein [Hymenobacter nivis]|uniref:Uncharacterized protein n=1 Tax=Hymenobacter nivis TaxID=1850093 RepID=A0A502GYL6_9BACT|nr:hypothetical protein [Hymenobacter nivis]TPG66063.1 hypothetical protein EAH73_11885 [Hymenobacter nivis]
MRVHFPARYGGAERETQHYYQQQQARTVALADYILTGAPKYLDAVAELDAWLLDQATPEIFDDGAPENVLTLNRRRFGHLCATLADQGFPRPHELTVFDFNAAIDYLAEKNKTA